MVEQKAYAPFELKQVDVESRTFTGLASTWDLDLDGDVIQQGAFAKSLNDWRASNGKRIIPLIDQHNYRSVRSVFGRLEDASETDAGLETTFSIVKSGDGDEYLTRIEQGYLNGLSIGFKTITAGPEEREIGGQEVEVRVIRELKLMEVSAVIWGANPNALIDTAAAKALIQSLAGRDLAPAERTDLESLREKIDVVLKGSDVERPGIAFGTPEQQEMVIRRQRLQAHRAI